MLLPLLNTIGIAQKHSFGPVMLDSIPSQNWALSCATLISPFLGSYEEILTLSMDRFFKRFAAW